MSFKCIVLLSLVCVAFGYPSGAPEEACETMLPQHDAIPQTTPAPYTVRVIRAGNNFDIEVTANSATTPILGFISQVRDANEARIGRFDILASDTFAKTLDCGGVVGSAATHKGGISTQRFSVKWIAPSTAFPVASLRLTVVTSKEVFWSNIRVNLLSFE